MTVIVLVLHKKQEVRGKLGIFRHGSQNAHLRGLKLRIVSKSHTHMT